MDEFDKEMKKSFAVDLKSEALQVLSWLNCGRPVFISISKASFVSSFFLAVPQCLIIKTKLEFFIFNTSKLSFKKHYHSLSFFIQGLLGPKKELWDLLQKVEKLDAEAADITASVRDLPTVRTAIGRARAWLRLALMQKKLSDYFRLIKCTFFVN